MRLHVSHFELVARPSEAVASSQVLELSKLSVFQVTIDCSLACRAGVRPRRTDTSKLKIAPSDRALKDDKHGETDQTESFR